MEQLDPQMTQRVWQRVQGTPQEDSLPLVRMLILSCAAGYARLGKYFRGQEGDLLGMRTEFLHFAACLQGIRYLRTGQRLPESTPASVQEPAETTLRKCLAHCLRLHEALRKEASDPEYGPVFAFMAEKIISHTRLLLELIGK